MSVDLSKIGTPKELFEQKKSSPFIEYLTDWMEDKIVKLREAAPSASKNLQQSIQLNIDGQGAHLEIVMADYFDFVNKGVNGVQNAFGSPYSFKTIKPSKGMVDAMKETMWAGHKGIQPKQGQTLEQTLYAISVSVKKKGIKPTKFFDKVINEKELSKLAEDVAEKFGVAIAISMKKVLEKE